jgi:hypothetical protein
VSDKVEQALRLLSGPCPHNRPDSEAPRTKPNCLQCLSETAREVIAKEIESNHSDRECSFIDPWNYKVYKCSHVKDAAIARGSK